MSEALGLALLHSCWQGAVAAAALFALRGFVHTAAMRYALAWAALLAVPAGFACTLALAWPSGSGGFTARSFSFLPLRLPPIPDGTFTSPAAIMPWIAPLWAAGAALVYAYQIAGWLAARRLRRRGLCAVPPEWAARLVALGNALGVRKPVGLYESALADVPVVLGHLRPLVLLPAGLLLQMPPEHVEAILRHELAHIRRHDYLLNLLQRAIEGWFYYHPAVWWIGRMIREEREFCCDDIAASSGRVADYAEALAALEQRRLIGQPAAFAVAATGGDLMQRIERLVASAQPKPRSGSPLALALVLATALAASLPAWQAATPPDPYGKWLNEDVVYIIADAERAAFERLKTNEEREMFIVQFWQRRDPSPTTASENEFKEEHYRRIRYANGRFATRTKPGWQTERGRMYIVYGPPDEIESHPSGGRGRARPWEMWLYHRIPGMGDNLTLTFVDAESNGDYRLAPGYGR